MVLRDGLEVANLHIEQALTGICLFFKWELDYWDFHKESDYVLFNISIYSMTAVMQLYAQYSPVASLKCLIRVRRKFKNLV